mmetsp:Transcript_13558/g.43413  ORF Transcript_13558/g.43413 Transcript_13558/m.43413 type:complete len:239 (+) Transcript_13558:675-1391(+)
MANLVRCYTKDLMPTQRERLGEFGGHGRLGVVAEFVPRLRPVLLARAQPAAFRRGPTVDTGGEGIRGEADGGGTGEEGLGQNLAVAGGQDGAGRQQWRQRGGGRGGRASGGKTRSRAGHCPRLSTRLSTRLRRGCSVRHPHFGRRPRSRTRLHLGSRPHFWLRCHFELRPHFGCHAHLGQQNRLAIAGGVDAKLDGIAAVHPEHRVQPHRRLVDQAPLQLRRPRGIHAGGGGGRTDAD